MNVSVIIPTLNEAGYIGELLTDLSSQSLRPREIILVDGSSTDQTRMIAESFEGVQVITTTPGVGHQRTRGGNLAQGEWLLFLDADVRLEQKFIEELLHKAEKRNLQICCPRYWPPHTASIIVKVAFYFFNAMFFIFQKIVPSGAGPCILVKKELFNQVKGFANYNYEDIEFIRKASKKGKFGIVPVSILTSDRRFKKYGSLSIFLQYLLLSPFFIFGAFKLANIVKYPFGGYSKSR
jgi:glycosyltransferase involved in cell wall biosynthesis